MSESTTIDAPVLSGPCSNGCGRTVTRLIIPGKYGKLVNDRPLWCEACIVLDNEQRREDDLRAEREELTRSYHRRLALSGLPEAHHGLTLDELDHDPKIVSQARLWAAGDLRGLLLTGNVGTGKTTLAGAAALKRLRTHSLTWTSAPLLFARLGSGLGSDARDWAIRLLEGRHALVLDDIDKARPTEYGAEHIFLAVDQRVEHNVPLLVTSNLSVSSLAEKWPPPYGEAIASRLFGYCRVVNVVGEDRRVGGGPR